MEKLKNFPRTIIFICFLLLASTLVTWYITKSLAERETARVFNNEASIVESWITNRFELYKTITYGLQAFLSDNERVTEEKWLAYAEILKIKERFPGIASISLAKRANDNFIVTFVYPAERKTAIGINLVTQPNRLETINKAINTNSPMITNKIFLTADQSPGFAMYAPVYKTEFHINTVEERKAAVDSLIVLAFKSEQVFKDLFDAHDPFPHLDFELYKGKVLEEDHILYDHDYSHYIPKGELKKRLETKRTITFEGETFTLLVASKPSFGLTTLEKQLPNIVLITGLVFSFLFCVFALSGFQRLQKKVRP